MNDWECPYCGVIAQEGSYKLRHLSKHIPAVRRMLEENFRLNTMLAIQEGNKLNESIQK